MLLTTPLAIKALTLRNRLVLPPMATEKSVSEGEVSQALRLLQRENARRLFRPCGNRAQLH